MGPGFPGAASPSAQQVRGRCTAAPRHAKLVYNLVVTILAQDFFSRPHSEPRFEWGWCGPALPRVAHLTPIARVAPPLLDCWTDGGSCRAGGRGGVVCCVPALSPFRSLAAPGLSVTCRWPGRGPFGFGSSRRFRLPRGPWTTTSSGGACGRDLPHCARGGPSSSLRRLLRRPQLG